jgi:hypothetical protein
MVQTNFSNLCPTTPNSQYAQLGAFTLQYIPPTSSSSVYQINFTNTTYGNYTCQGASLNNFTCTPQTVSSTNNRVASNLQSSLNSATGLPTCPLTINYNSDGTINNTITNNAICNYLDSTNTTSCSTQSLCPYNNQTDENCSINGWTVSN